ncbi:hypothetical protein J6590_039756 [Homalodisca vitripennis]|nr:hypothetical protein J6590_039756 [Homalodisca vitripennis]
MAVQPVERRFKSDIVREATCGNRVAPFCHPVGPARRDMWLCAHPQSRCPVVMNRRALPPHWFILGMLRYQYLHPPASKTLYVTSAATSQLHVALHHVKPVNARRNESVKRAAVHLRCTIDDYNACKRHFVTSHSRVQSERALEALSYGFGVKHGRR